MKLCCLNRTKCTIECEYAIVSEPRSGIALSVSFDIGTNADAGKDSQSAFGYVELYGLMKRWRVKDCLMYTWCPMR